jgi:hypothetical protein
VVELREAIRSKLLYVLGKTPEAARERDWFAATALALRDRIVDAFAVFADEAEVSASPFLTRTDRASFSTWVSPFVTAEDVGLQ